VPGSVVILLASESGIGDLEDLVKRSRSKPAPMEFLEQWVREDFPTVDWVGSPAVSTEQVRAGTVPTVKL